MWYIKKDIPSWLKYASGIFLAILVPSYWVYYGPANFLWLSDIVLFLTLGGILLKSRLLISMAAVGGIVIELLWGLEFLFCLFCRFKFFPNITGYMFDPALPIWLRFLSFFHLVLPFLLLFLVARLGYLRKALPLQTALALLLLIISRLATDPAKNINGVFSDRYFTFLTPFSYFVIQIGLLFLIFYGTHCYLKTLKKS